MDKEDLKNFLLILSGFKKVSSSQRRKIASLLKRDFVNYNEDVILNSDEKLKDDKEDTPQLNTLSENVSSTESHRKSLGNTKYISPKNLQLFLKAFNQDEVLKYTCHLIDNDETIDNICQECGTEEYDYIKHVELIKKRFKLLRDKFKKQEYFLSPNMMTLINVYLTGEDFKGNKTNPNGESFTWSSNKININWNCEELRQWANDCPHIIPNPGKNIGQKQKNSGFSMKTAIISEIDGKRIKSFSELVIFFKNQFHIRKDNSLLTILAKTNEKWADNNVLISFSEEKYNPSVELFTDIDKLIQVYNNIIRICINCKEKELEPVRIELSFFDDDKLESTFFCIHHLNSVYRKSLKSTKDRIGEAQASLIKNQINGLCDLYIEAKFEKGKQARINLWDDKKEMVSQEVDKEIEGVKYILKF